jgi:hypothetical protein
MKQVSMTQVPIESSVFAVAKSNRDRTNPSWSMSAYIEHIIAMHEAILTRLEAENGN